MSDVVEVAAARAVDAPARDAANNGEPRTFAVGNPLGLVVGRIGGDLGTFAAPHVVPVASFHVQAIEGAGMNNAIAGLGGELGVRLYGGAARPTGPFFGVYALGGRYYASNQLLDLERASTIMSYGGAADIGFSVCTSKNVVVAFGGGVELRRAQQEPNAPFAGGLVDVVALGGIKPRAIFQVGAFF